MANEQNDRTKTNPAPTAANTAPVSEPYNGRDPEKRTSGNGAGMNDEGTGLYEQAKETASESYDVVANKATSSIEQRKNEFSSGLKTVADSVREVGGQIRTKGEPSQLTDMASEYSHKTAHALDGVANYFERKDLRAITRDIEDFARRNPAIFLGGAFALGLLAARFLKSSPPRHMSGSRHTIGMQPTSLPPTEGRPGSSFPRPV
jgi:hypothetical protein